MPHSKKCSVPAASETGLVSAEEAERLFWPSQTCDCLLLAVSGGSDSMALMWLAARIYRVGMLMYGKKATIPEVVRWIRQA